MYPTDLIDESIEEADGRAGCLKLNKPNIRVIATPTEADNHLMSRASVKQFAGKKLTGLELSETERGIYAATPPPNKLTGHRIEEKTEYWGVNEYGLVYYRQILTKHERRDCEYLLSPDLMKYIVRSMKTARSFYQQCGDIGNIDITVNLQQVEGEYLAHTEYDDKQDIEQQECKRPDVAARAECCSQGLVDRDRLINIVDTIIFQLIREFGGFMPPQEDDKHRRKYIARIVDRRP